jgi:hypothetical protein
VKYTLKNFVSPSYLTVGLFSDYDEARQARDNLYADFSVEPVLTQKEFDRTPKDYKGYKEGVPYILYLTEHGTTYGPALIIDEKVLAANVIKADGSRERFANNKDVSEDITDIFIRWNGSHGLTKSIRINVKNTTQ